MPRPRVHDLDRVLDAAEELAVGAGPAAVTIRALSEATSVSNGALYHAFGSRAGLLGRAWLRAAESFLQLQRDVVEQALSGRDHADDAASAVEAVVVAALCPALFSDRKPTSAQFLLTVPRGELLRAGEIPADVAEDLRRLDTALGELLVRLSARLWGRRDRQSVALIRDCVVHLPTALLLRGNRTADTAARDRLAAAVRAVLTIPPATP